MPNIGIENGVLVLPEQAAPSSAAGVGKLYATVGQKLSFVDSGGTDTELGAGGSSVTSFINVIPDESTVSLITMTNVRVTVDP
jgi:hypothetical protein